MLPPMRKLLALAGTAVLALGLVLVARALRFTAEPSPLPPPVDVEIDAEAVAARLAGALRIPTISRGTPPHVDTSTFAAMHAYLEESFPVTHARLHRETVNTHTLLYRWDGSDPSLAPVLLMAHLDVVPVSPGTEADWTHPPFGGVVADGYIWGRGALDVKSGVVGLLEAVERALAAGFAPTRSVYLCFGHDEEIGGGRGAAAVAALLRERGVRLSTVVDEGGTITQGIVPGVAAPIALIGVAEKGYVSVRLRVQGKGGHSSMPPRQGAIGVLAAALGRLEADPFPAHLDHAGRFFERVGPRMSFGRRVLFANLWLFGPLVEQLLAGNPPMNAVMRTTVAPTIVRAGDKDNVLPIEAEAIVNHRIIPGETIESVLAHDRAVVADARVELERADSEFGSDPSPVSSWTSPAFLAMAESVRAVAQDPELIVVPYLVLGATDSRYFTDLADDVYRFMFNWMGPDDLPRIHGTDERIAVAQYANTVRFYSALLRRLAGPATPSP